MDSKLEFYTEITGMKIFLGEKTILLSDRPPVSISESDTKVAFHSKEHLKKVFQEFVEDEGATNLIIYTESAYPTIPLLSSFLSLFKIIEAAGGFVKNEKGECLFIYRRGKWDLPKGKITVRRHRSTDHPLWQTDDFLPELTAEEHKEQAKIKEPYDKAAIREVMEETGLHDIRIIRELPRTYHIYRQRGKWILKPTSWFEMYAPDDQALIPEEKEDISEVRWFSRDGMKIIKENTYPSIRELLCNYFSSNLSA